MKAPHQDQEEDYFVSMTDMMVGILLIFIILLMYFVLQFHTRTDELIKANQSAAKLRAAILNQIKEDLEDRDTQLRVIVDEENGVLRLEGDVLFDSAKYDLSPTGKKTLQNLADILTKILPCYVWHPPDFQGQKCDRPTPVIEALFVEGHTDNVPLVGVAGGPKDNYDLSALRATTAFRELVSAKPVLTQFLTDENGSPVLSVSGYGPDRPSVPSGLNKSEPKNRRIEFRMIMQTPVSKQLENIRQRMREQP